jgi:GNAT superfamily N-acetyltransferase
LNLRFEQLERRHDRQSFQSGDPQLDDWFKTRASQDQRRRIAQVYVAVDDHGIVGFYSLSMSTVILHTLPEEVARKLPRYETIPAALIGRLARAERAKGTGIGGLLLNDAFRRVLAAAQSVAAHAIVVDAKDDHAVRFYESRGFVRLIARTNRLFIPAETVASALATASSF